MNDARRELAGVGAYRGRSRGRSEDSGATAAPRSDAGRHAVDDRSAVDLSGRHSPSRGQHSRIQAVLHRCAATIACSRAGSRSVHSSRARVVRRLPSSTNTRSEQRSSKRRRRDIESVAVDGQSIRMQALQEPRVARSQPVVLRLSTSHPGLPPLGITQAAASKVIRLRTAATVRVLARPPLHKPPRKRTKRRRVKRPSSARRKRDRASTSIAISDRAAAT